MKGSLHQYCISVLLTAAVLFSQTGINLLHNHAVESSFTPERHINICHSLKGEGCNICALDLFLTLFLEPSQDITFIAREIIFESFAFYSFHSVGGFATQDRAPPSTLI